MRMMGILGRGVLVAYCHQDIPSAAALIFPLIFFFCCGWCAMAGRTVHDATVFLVNVGPSMTARLCISGFTSDKADLMVKPFMRQKFLFNLRHEIGFVVFETVGRGVDPGTICLLPVTRMCSFPPSGCCRDSRRRVAQASTICARWSLPDVILTVKAPSYADWFSDPVVAETYTRTRVLHSVGCHQP